MDKEINADLIAAAPELLAAAKATLNHLYAKARRDPAEREVVRALEEAIDKAEGRK